MTNVISIQLEALGIRPVEPIYVQLPVPELIEHAVKQNQGNLTNSGALSFTTGKFTGRSPESRFIVQDQFTIDQVNWGK